MYVTAKVEVLRKSIVRVTGVNEFRVGKGCGIVPWWKEAVPSGLGKHRRRNGTDGERGLLTVEKGARHTATRRRRGISLGIAS